MRWGGARLFDNVQSLYFVNVKIKITAFIDMGFSTLCLFFFSLYPQYMFAAFYYLTNAGVNLCSLDKTWYRCTSNDQRMFERVCWIMSIKAKLYSELFLFCSLNFYSLFNLLLSTNSCLQIVIYIKIMIFWWLFVCTQLFFFVACEP